MVAYNVSQSQLEQAAASVDTRIIEFRSDRGTSVRFRLGLNPSHRWQRISASYFNQGRKVAAVCWHGHREFFRALFKLAPEARIQTASTRMLGKGRRFYTADNFEEIYQETDRNIGPQISPMQYSEACTHEIGE